MQMKAYKYYDLNCICNNQLSLEVMVGQFCDNAMLAAYPLFHPVLN